MKLQNVSFSMASINYSNVGKDAKANTTHGGKGYKVNNQQDAASTLSSNPSFDKMIENIQEKIQKVRQNDHYDADAKKSKIEELEKQLKEIQEAQRAEEAKAFKGTAMETKKSSNSADTKTNADGDTLEINLDTRALLEANVNLGNLKNAYSMKKNLEGQSNVLKSEIQTDKGRDINTERKEAQLSKMAEGIERTTAQLSEAIKNANTSADERSKRVASATETSYESNVDGNDDSMEPTGNVPSNIVTEPMVPDQAIGDIISR